MPNITKTALFAVSLLATTSLTGVAHGQAAYSKAGTNFVPVQQHSPIVSYTQDGTSYQSYGQTTQGYTKGGPVVQYAPIEYVPEQPAVYEAAVVPVVEIEGSVGSSDVMISDDIMIDDSGVIEASFIDPEIDTLIDDLADEDLDFEDPIAAAVSNFIRISGGYGFATQGSFGYGAQSGAADYSVQDHYTSDIQMRGPSGSFRVDVASFFVDGGFGYYTQAATDEVDDDLDGLTGVIGDSVGPEFSWVDGTQTDVLGFTSAVYETTDTYTTGDILKTTYARTSTLTDFGGAAGYSFNFGGGLGLGIGVAGRRIQGSHVIAVTQDAQDSTGTSYDTDFTYADHNLEVSYAGNYVGPVVRINFDQNLGSRLTAHFGGSAQALYGQRTLDAKQTDTAGTTLSEITQVAVNGFAFGGEVDAGIGFAVTDNLSLSVGGFGSFLSAAPSFVPYDTDLATEGTGDFATMTDQSLVTYGLKGSLSLRF